MIKAIIFDIGGVVTFTNFQELYSNFARRVGISPEFVSQYHKENWDENLLGSISLEQFFQIMKGAGAREGLDLQAIWLEEALKIRRVNTELLEAIAKMRKHYIVGVLSNLTPTRMMVDEHLKLYDNFDFVVLSCVERKKKPDPEFYNLALEKAKAKPSEAVFIDDRERNVVAAREMGFRDILYTDNQKLFQDFHELNILIEA